MDAVAPILAGQRAIGLEGIRSDADRREFRRHAALEDVAADEDRKNGSPSRNLAGDDDGSDAIRMQSPRAGDERVEKTRITPVGLVVVFGEVASDDEDVRLDRPDGVEHVVVDRPATRRARDALIHGDVLDQRHAKDRGERQEIGLGPVDLLQSGEKMGGVRVADNENRRLPRILDRRATMAPKKAAARSRSSSSG